MAEKVALVVGAAGGIGKAIAIGLAKQGMRVVALVRNDARGEEVARDVAAAAPSAPKAEWLTADLESMRSVRDAAAAFDRKYARLDALVLSAAVFLKERRETVDGFERTIAINYFSQFVLTNALVPKLKASAPSRVVIVSSRYGNSKIDFDDLMLKNKKFTTLTSVPPTKLAQILFAQELAERLAGTGVTVNAMHPGLVKNTKLLEEVGGMWKLITNTFGGSAEKGADTAVWLATSPEVAGKTGRMWSARKEMATPGQGSDPAARKRLWAETEKLLAGRA